MIRRTLVALALVAALPGCGPNVSPTAKPTPSFVPPPPVVPAPPVATVAPGTPPYEPTILVRIRGEDVIISDLVPIIAEQFLQVEGAGDVREQRLADGIDIAGSTIAGRRVEVRATYASEPEAIRALQRGDADLAALGEPIPIGPATEQGPAGDIASPQATYAIARTAVMVIVPRSNPVSRLSYSQLRDIYAGRITDWSEVGGRPGPIRIYGRTMDASSEQSFRTNVMGTLRYGRGYRAFRSFVTLRDAVVHDPSAIGYTNANGGAGLKFVPLTVNGRVPANPDEYGVATGDYPLFLDLALYHAPARKSDYVDAFLSAAASVRTQVVVQNLGFAPQGARLLFPPATPKIAPQYDPRARNALRISTTIRFAPDSTQLDADAVNEVAELAAYVRYLAVSPDHVVLVAFSDDTGNPARDLATSATLGAVVARALSARRAPGGIVVPLGATLPLASNAVPGGRRTNRRVETWILP